MLLFFMQSIEDCKLTISLFFFFVSSCCSRFVCSCRRSSCTNTEAPIHPEALITLREEQLTVYILMRPQIKSSRFSKIACLYQFSLLPFMKKKNASQSFFLLLHYFSTLVNGRQKWPCVIRSRLNSIMAFLVCVCNQ